MSDGTYLDTYLLQKDMRVRMPKAILSNMAVEKGTTKFDIYMSPDHESLVLRVHKEEDGGAKNE